jgi:hypothetical protein
MNEIGDVTPTNGLGALQTITMEKVVSTITAAAMQAYNQMEREGGYRTMLVKEDMPDMTIAVADTFSGLTNTRTNWYTKVCLPYIFTDKIFVKQINTMYQVIVPALTPAGGVPRTGRQWSKTNITKILRYTVAFEMNGEVYNLAGSGSAEITRQMINLYIAIWKHADVLIYSTLAMGGSLHEKAPVHKNEDAFMRLAEVQKDEAFIMYKIERGLYTLCHKYIQHIELKANTKPDSIIIPYGKTSIVTTGNRQSTEFWLAGPDGPKNVTGDGTLPTICGLKVIEAPLERNKHGNPIPLNNKVYAGEHWVFKERDNFPFIHPSALNGDATEQEASTVNRIHEIYDVNVDNYVSISSKTALVKSGCFVVDGAALQGKTYNVDRRQFYLVNMKHTFKQQIRAMNVDEFNKVYGTNQPNIIQTKANDIIIGNINYTGTMAQVLAKLKFLLFRPANCVFAQPLVFVATGGDLGFTAHSKDNRTEIGYDNETDIYSLVLPYRIGPVITNWTRVGAPQNQCFDGLEKGGSAFLMTMKEALVFKDNEFEYPSASSPSIYCIPIPADSDFEGYSKCIDLKGRTTFSSESIDHYPYPQWWSELHGWNTIANNLGKGENMPISSMCWRGYMRYQNKANLFSEVLGEGIFGQYEGPGCAAVRKYGIAVNPGISENNKRMRID